MLGHEVTATLIAKGTSARPVSDLAAGGLMQIYLPIADVSVNAFLLLAIGSVWVWCRACSGSAADS